jgi:uncharacterized membrane protein YhiD involved in acid resistance
MTTLRAVSGLAARVATVSAALLILLAPAVLPTAVAAGRDQFPPPTAEAQGAAPATGFSEIQEALVRLPLAAVLGTILALRPRHRGRMRRNALVVQTQIMLAVVGAVIMLVVGQSLARAFGIVGAANLIRYRSTIDDPKEAVVMLCALAAGLAAGVGLYWLAPFATLFMTAVLWVVEYFEPTARKNFELKVSLKKAADLRPKLEDVLTGFKLEFELLSESEDELGYSISAPVDVRTRDVSDTIRLVSQDDEVSIEWDEKKSKK